MWCVCVEGSGCGVVCVEGSGCGVVCVCVCVWRGVGGYDGEEKKTTTLSIP